MKFRKNLYLEQENNWVHSSDSSHKALEYFTNRYNCNSEWFHKPLLSSIVNVVSPFNAEKEILTAEDFNEYCEELLDAWLSDMSVEKYPQYCREVNEDDPWDYYEPTFMYTKKGSDMVERAMSRLSELGRKYFDEFCVEIKTSMYIEY